MSSTFKLNILILLLFCLSTNLIAKVDSLGYYTTKNQIKVGYGYTPINNFYTGFSSFTLNHTDNDLYPFYFLYYKSDGDKRKIGSFILEYKRNIKPRLNIGANIVIDNYKILFNHYNNITKTDQTTSSKHFGLTVMSGASFHYLNHKLIDLYLGGELGFFYIKEKTEYPAENYAATHNKLFFAYNFTGFGIQLKTIVAPYLQINIGSRGWIEGGIAFNIK